MQFRELTLPDCLMDGISKTGFTTLTPIQEQSLPFALQGRDIAGQAQTGTGKTAAFLIALFNRLLITPPEKPGMPRALILAPTRELVVQIEKDARDIGRSCNFVVQAIYGGVDYMQQRQALKDGVDVIIGTPGRLIDYLKQKIYSLKGIEVLVIDEADRMFDMGFIPDLRFILRRLPAYDQRQNFLFSATLNQRVKELSYEFMNLPVPVSVTPETVTAERVSQQLYHVAREEKLPLLLGLLRDHPMERTIVFINTKREAERLHLLLEANGYKNRILSGDVEQKKRLRILEQFKSGELPLMIATDVASRGLHIDGVTHVVNYDLPQDPEDYVHRIGRTARAGASGHAFSFADEDGAFCIEAIEEYIGAKIPVFWAEDANFVQDYIKKTAHKPSVKPAHTTSSSHRRHAKPVPKKTNTKAAPQQGLPAGSTPEAKPKRRRPPRHKKSGSSPTGQSA